jgi:predicted alpha/beta-hydrolase family hydrolase
MLEIETPFGLARAEVRVSGESRGTLVLGHGAGGGIGAPDLVAVARAAESERIGVVLVEQPYRVAGRRSPAPARQLDGGWIAVVEHLRSEVLADAPVVVGGRSAGARVACRTADVTRAVGVLCLAFPLQPPRRTGSAPSRLDELDAVTVPTLVVQGERDPFGMPPTAPRRTVVQVRGDHSLRTDLDAVASAVAPWLVEVLTRGA